MLLTKRFSSSSLAVGGVATLTFTLTNTSGGARTGITFTDTLPLTMVVATPNGLTNPSGVAGITADEGTGVISVSGASLADAEIVVFSVQVTAAIPGIYDNVTGLVSTTEDGEIAESSASSSISMLASSGLLIWSLMRFDAKTREEEEA